MSDLTDGTAAAARPLVSIITVCRNSSISICRAFDSVLIQAYRPIEYVIIDGLSSDCTLDVIKEYEPKFASTGIDFQYVSEPDRGIYDAMNKGISMVRGHLIGILNSDDFYEPHAVETVARASVDYPNAGIFYGFLRVLTAGQEVLIYRYRYEHYLLDLTKGIYSAAQHPTCFVRADVYGQIGNFDISFSSSADHDFLIRAMRSGVKFFPVEAILSNFASGGTSDSLSDHERHKQRYAVFFKNKLISDNEYRLKQKELRYKKYNELKKKIAGLVFRF